MSGDEDGSLESEDEQNPTQDVRSKANSGNRLRRGGEASPLADLQLASDEDTFNSPVRSVEVCT